MLLDSGGVHPYGSFWLDVADKAIKALALVVAAAWTYLRADTYRKKIEPSVTGELFLNNGEHYAAVTCSLKNLGQSRYVILQRGTYLSAVVLRASGRQTIEGAEVFRDHGWIEPEEKIDEPLILRVPDPETFVGLRLNLRVVSQSGFEFNEDSDWGFVRRRIEWNSSCILRQQPESSAALPKEEYDV